MTRLFYSSEAYRSKQSALTKKNWEAGRFEFLRKQVKRMCVRKGCKQSFVVVPHDQKKYCSQTCAAISNNTGRTMSEAVKQRISRSLIGKPNPHKGEIKVPRIEVSCANLECSKRFLKEVWRTKRRFCSNQCAMKIIGGRPTSPKASKGKNGIRLDISSTINFYSRWEANIARLFTVLNIKWQYAPRSFDIGGQRYTPDFYLPDKDAYIEVKNFWWPYSKKRDEKFRERYPSLRLEVILKDEYVWLEKYFSHLVPHWEYKNSKL